MSADYTQPLAVTKRMRFYDGQYLMDQDFIDEQKYQVSRHDRHQRTLHTSGIVEGLGVTIEIGSSTIVVGSGLAIEANGRQILLETDQTITVDTDGYLYIAYHQVAVDYQTGGAGLEDNTRWQEQPYIFISENLLGEGDSYDGPDGETEWWVDYLAAEDGPPPPVLLAQVNDGTVSFELREYAGIQLPGFFASAIMRRNQEGTVDLLNADLAVNGSLETHSLSITDSSASNTFAGSTDFARNVTIGTASSNANLTVQGSFVAHGLSLTDSSASNTFAGPTDFTSDVEIGTAAATADLTVIGTIQAKSLSLTDNSASNTFAGPTDFTSDVEIGTAAATADLTVIGTIEAKSLSLTNGSASNTFAGPTDFTRNVVIGTAASNASLTVQGSITANSLSMTNSAVTNTFAGNMGIDGNVGIGIDDPASMLHVNDKLISSTTTAVDQGYLPDWINYTNTRGLFVHVGNDNAFFGMRNRDGEGGGVDEYDAIIYFGDNPNDNLVFETKAGGEALRVTGAGRLAYRQAGYFTRAASGVTVDKDNGLDVSVPSGTTDDWNIFVSLQQAGALGDSAYSDNAVQNFTCSAAAKGDKTGWTITAYCRYKIRNDEGEVKDGIVNYLIVPR